MKSNQYPWRFSPFLSRYNTHIVVMYVFFKFVIYCCCMFDNTEYRYSGICPPFFKLRSFEKGSCPVIRNNLNCEYWVFTSTCTGIMRPKLDIIHLLHAGEGNMKIYSPKSIIFLEGKYYIYYTSYINYHNGN